MHILWMYLQEFMRKLKCACTPNVGSHSPLERAFHPSLGSCQQTLCLFNVQTPEGPAQKVKIIAGTGLQLARRRIWRLGPVRSRCRQQHK